MAFRHKALTLLGLGLVFVTFQNCGAPMATDDGASAAPDAAQALHAKADQVLQARCVSCHNSTLASGDIDLTDTNELLFLRLIVPGEPQLSPLFNVIQDGQMPPTGGLSAAEAQAISDWILDGFKDVEAGPVQGSAPLTPTFKSIYANVISARCTACHSGANAGAGIQLTDYNTVKMIVRASNLNGSALYTSVATRKTMPKGAAPLSTEQVAAIKSWIEQGAMNN